MYNFSQEQIFIFFFIIGIIIGILFDIFRVIRKSFLISSGSIIILGIIKLNSGEVRLFLFLGIFFGILIYTLTISNLCVIILYVFVKICKKILNFPFYCIKKLLKGSKKIIKKDF